MQKTKKKGRTTLKEETSTRRIARKRRREKVRQSRKVNVFFLPILHMLHCGGIK
jgi:hypothetical protein